MTTICYAVVLLAATVSITLSIQNIPWQCEWAENCSDGQILMAKCNCDCPGTYLCCDQSILEKYSWAKWYGTAVFCKGTCSNCGSVWDLPDLCWWDSVCGDGKRCWTGGKTLCGIRKSKKNIAKIVSLLLLSYAIIIHA